MPVERQKTTELKHSRHNRTCGHNPTNPTKRLVRTDGPRLLHGTCTLCPKNHLRLRSVTINGSLNMFQRFFLSLSLSFLSPIIITVQYTNKGKRSSCVHSILKYEFHIITILLRNSNKKLAPYSKGKIEAPNLKNQNNAHARARTTCTS